MGLIGTCRKPDTSGQAIERSVALIVDLELLARKSLALGARSRLPDMLPLLLVSGFLPVELHVKKEKFLFERRRAIDFIVSFFHRFWLVGC